MLSSIESTAVSKELTFCPKVSTAGSTTSKRSSSPAIATSFARIRSSSVSKSISTVVIRVSKESISSSAWSTLGVNVLIFCSFKLALLFTEAISLALSCISSLPSVSLIFNDSFLNCI